MARSRFNDNQDSLFANVDGDNHTREYGFRGHDHPMPRWVTDEHRLHGVSVGARRLYDALLRHCNYSTGRVWGKYETMAAWARMAVGRVSLSIDELVAAYVIVRSGRYGQHPRFRLIGSLAEARQIELEHPAEEERERIERYRQARESRRQRQNDERAGRANLKRARRASDKRAGRAKDDLDTLSKDHQETITKQHHQGAAAAADDPDHDEKTQVLVTTGVRAEDAADLVRRFPKVPLAEYLRIAAVPYTRKMISNPGGFWGWVLKNPRTFHRGPDEAAVRERQHKDDAAQRPRRREPDRVTSEEIKGREVVQGLSEEQLDTLYDELVTHYVQQENADAVDRLCAGPPRTNRWLHVVVGRHRARGLISIPSQPTKQGRFE